MAMENHNAAERDDNNNGSMDRISELPEPILHHILSSISQYDAVRTSVLSKPWRYLWYGRPNLELHQTKIPVNTNTIMSCLSTALQRCHDQDLPIQSFFLEMSSMAFDSKSTHELLENLIKTLIQNNGVKTFHLHIIRRRVPYSYFHLPPLVFNSESVRELHLEGCLIGSISNILLKNLYTLSLTGVDISEVTLGNILSSCPLLVNLSLSLLGCSELKTIDMSNNNNKLHGLKHLTIRDLKVCFYEYEKHLSVKIDISTIETITIVACQFHHHNTYLPNLKSLTLEKVRLSNKSFEIFSPTYMPHLECLTLNLCYGFKEIKMVLSDSVKHITIREPKHHSFMNAVIEASNIVTFAYEGKTDDFHSYPASFVTNSIGWESKIYLWFYDKFNFGASSWFAMMNEQLGALSGSRISLELSQEEHIVDENYQDVHITWNWPLRLAYDQHQAAFYKRLPEIIFSGREYEPVDVEHLSLRGRYTHTTLAAFLYCMFRICHPRYVGHDLFCNALTSNCSEEKGAHKEVTLLLFVILVMQKEISEKFWPGALEDVKMESFDEGFNGEGSGVKFRFRLKWKEHQLS